MTRRLQITHSTSYRFHQPVAYGLQQLRKTPKTGHGQTIFDWQTQVQGGTRQLVFEDHHHNSVDLIAFDRHASEVVITCSGVVLVENANGVVGAHRGAVPLWLYQRASTLTRAGAGVRALLRGLDGPADLAWLHGLMAAIRAQVPYQLGVSDATDSAEVALARGAGVCQDHTHIFLACAREAGVPARYVSGYLMLDDTTQQSAMHAWAEAHVQGLGWVGFDVSNGICPDDRYVRVATGVDYSDAAPVTGTRIGGGAAETLAVQIQVAQQ